MRCVVCPLLKVVQVHQMDMRLVWGYGRSASYASLSMRRDGFNSRYPRQTNSISDKQQEPRL